MSIRLNKYILYHIMKAFSINTLGCKVNQYESQQIRELLERLGLSQVKPSESVPELIVINTCCVTHTASAKSRQYIRKAQKLSPNAPIVVSGCLPTVQIGELNTSSQKNVHFITQRDDLAAMLCQIVNSKVDVSNCQNPNSRRTTVIKTKNDSKIKCKNKLANPPKLTSITSFNGHTRAFLKIQDGCDGHCSYCIIPKVRPVVHSKPIQAVLKEAQGLVEAGHKEIVLTGIFLGSYGKKSVNRKSWAGKQNDKLAELLEKVAEIPNLARIRLSSLEPADVTERLLDVFCKHRNIMPHLHLSLQSGSDAILAKMRRQYRTAEFREKTALIRAKLDRPAITTDLIVGFPGETDDDFEQTVELAKEMGFAKMHIFSFSAREGTAAAKMQHTVNNEVIKRRSKKLRDLNDELGYRFRQQFVGERDTILTENSNGEICGRSERYFIVKLEKLRKNPQRNELVKVKLVENTEDGMTGEIVEQEQEGVNG